MTALTVPSGQHAEPVLCLAALTGWSEAALATGGRDKKVGLQAALFSSVSGGVPKHLRYTDACVT